MNIETLKQLNSSSQTILKDKFQRPLHDLRISVIDQCNFRCTYCMPKGLFPEDFKFTKKDDWLTFDEIASVVKITTQLGVEKIRITGGEPLLRPNISELVKKLSAIKSIKDLALTTNGSLLARHAKALKESGLKRLTVSLNTLDEKIFRQMNGGLNDLNNVMDGINAAVDNGFERIKINVVVQKGVNDSKIMEIIEYFRNTNHILRFIEYMDVGTCNHWNNALVVPSKEIISMINKHYPMKPASPNYFGEVSKRYLYADGAGEVGFVSSVSQPFCHSCTRARLSARGKLYTCLFSNEGHDLKAALRSSDPYGKAALTISNIWSEREDRYSEVRQSLHLDQEYTNRVEMFQIGG